MTATTIKLNGETKEMLDMVRSSNRQTYDELIRELIEEKLETHLELKQDVKKRVIKRMEELKAGRVKGMKFEQVYEKAYD